MTHRLSAVATVIAWLIGAVSAGNVRAQGETEVKIGHYPGITAHLPLYVADAKGFYKNAGLKPVFIPVAHGGLMNSMMGSGAIEFGFHSPSGVGLALQQGMDQVFVVGNVTMPWVLIARKNLKLPNKGQYPAVIRDLKDMKWGVYGRGSDGEIFMRVMAGDAKLDVDKDMAWIGVGGPATGLPALQAGKVDVYLTLSPAPTIATTLGYADTILDLRKGEGPGQFKGILFTALLTQRKNAIARPKAVDAMVAATIQSMCWLRKPENFNELMAIAKTRLPVAELSDKQFAEMIRENIPNFTSTIPASDFNTWNDMLLRSKILKEPLPAESTLWKTVPRVEPAC